MDAARIRLELSLIDKTAYDLSYTTSRRGKRRDVLNERLLLQDLEDIADICDEKKLMDFKNIIEEEIE